MSEIRSAWVIYRMKKGGEPEFFGIVKDKETADGELDVMNGLPAPEGGGWKAKALLLIGWGVFLTLDNKTPKSTQ